MLTPLEIHNKEFKRGFRGYNEEEVDEFLDRVIKDYETLYRDNMDLKETIDRLNSKLEHYQHMENTLHSTLVIAQETAEEVKLNAKKETELIIKEAEIRAQKLVDEAISKVRKLTGESEELQKQSQIFRTRLRTLLQAQMEMLNSAEEDEN
ncbi:MULTISPECIES: DivIVA domain-containing protein [Sporomusa]|jgi:cell division initiation protein|uniref:Septum site-determining protein DivIVA n=2 Tax=Sporomusa TaxID=2375 RepID=A0ABP2C7N9_9FIRM|nr:MULTISPECIES: DivIVA domain-containing protein [Sporomusa]MCM0757107.1 DivIVA domain-containing protein [Sporomusa sphaeroides DSM 2875]OLS58613.1 septum site-determining protein DivIVA [Sporomusa sphaeroides DSM 2875]CVK19877.1 Septum site-determining protein DivIVA [Sporomusa sphaeroides DSM 2875]SCM80012.1 Septum site-determining protein DivIVA [uncultured Sporomusa sp.]HML34437.1 DivIVA domain-containing protein [Sporomusa sphaeroides]